MPRIKDATRADRRSTILDAAERCFSRSGFHATSMQQICAEAAMSPGNLYRYFPSKEAIIEGLCHRDLDEAADDFATLPQADDLMAALRTLGEQHMVERPREKIAVWFEFNIEAARNPQIAAIAARSRAFVRERLGHVIEMARRSGAIAPRLDTAAIVDMLMTMSDGIMSRRITDPAFDPQPQFDMLMTLFGMMLDGTFPPSGDHPFPATVSHPPLETLNA